MQNSLDDSPSRVASTHPSKTQTARSYSNDTGWSSLPTLVSGATYVLTSMSLMGYNKYLMHQGNFPFALPLVLLHTSVSSALAALMFVAAPSMFPALNNAFQKGLFDFSLLKNATLVAILFSAQIVLNASAYRYSSLTFIQMTKEANLGIVYGVSVVLAHERLKLPNACTLAVVALATMLTVTGEVRYSRVGFVIQIAGQCFECVRIVIQGLLLSDCAGKLDPMSYVLMVMPLSSIFLGAVSCFVAMTHPIEYLQLPTWQLFLEWWPILFLNAGIAFALNVSIAYLMKHSSAIGLVLAGIVKDTTVVLLGASYYTETVTHLQVMCFVTQLAGIFAYSLMTKFPKQFEDIMQSKMSLCPRRWPMLLSARSDYGAIERALRSHKEAVIAREHLAERRC